MKKLALLALCVIGMPSVLWAQQTKVSLLTYNVHNCVGLDKQCDYQRIADVICAASPDVVALQELDSVTDRNGGIYALKVLKEMTGMAGIYASAIPFQGGGYGIAVLSKEKPVKYEAVPMPGREEKRVLLVAEYKDYVFACTHQSLTREDREAAVPLILKALEKNNKPVFLAGDMNAIPIEKSQELLSNHFIVLNDVAEHTFPTDAPTRCIDYIYAYSTNGYRFGVTERKVIDEPVASDHRPVQVVVTIEE